MQKRNDDAADRANIAAIKEERLRDGKLALREYELNRSAVLVNMSRLRALRLSHEAGMPLPAEPKAPSSRKKRWKK